MSASEHLLQFSTLDLFFKIASYTFCIVCQIPQTLYILHCLPDSIDTLHCALPARFHRHSTFCTVCQILQTIYIVHQNEQKFCIVCQTRQKLKRSRKFRRHILEKTLPDTPEKCWGLPPSIPHHIESPGCGMSFQAFREFSFCSFTSLLWFVINYMRQYSYI